MRKWVYMFGNGQFEGSVGECDILGSKGVNFVEMVSLGFFVLFGVIIIFFVCIWYVEYQCYFFELLFKQIEQVIVEIECMFGCMFGGVKKLFFFVVCFGLCVLIFGMIEVIFNFGFNDEIVEVLVKEIGDWCFVYDCYCCFISSFGDVVMGLDCGYFEDLIEVEMCVCGVSFDIDFDVDVLVDIVGVMKEFIFEEMSEFFLQDLCEQFWVIIFVIYQVWFVFCVSVYCVMYGILVEWGMVLNFQVMVFGNCNVVFVFGVVLMCNLEMGEK